MTAFTRLSRILAKLRRRHHRERHLDELLVPVDRFQGATHIVGDVGKTSLLGSDGRFHDCYFEGKFQETDHGMMSK